MIGTIQIALHIPLLNVQVPSNAIDFYKIVIPVVNYDVLSSIPQYEEFISDLSRGKYKVEKSKEKEPSRVLQEEINKEKYVTNIP